MNCKSLTSLVAAMVLLAVSGCNKTKQEVYSKPPVPVKVAEVSAGEYAAGKSYVGTVEEKTSTQLSFSVAGSITALLADEGQRVAKGQVVARLDPATLKSAHDGSLATLRQAEDAYRRYKALHKSQTISDIQWAEVESKLEQAKATERMAREQLSHCTLRSPSAGVIASRNVEVGANVAPGQEVYRLVDISSVNINISVPEGEIAGINVGQEATFTVAALGGSSYRCKVTEIGVEANPLSHTYNVKMQMPNPGRRLMPGMVCSVKLLPGRQTDKILLPPSCVNLDTDGRRFVWIAENGKARQRYIAVGNFSGNFIEVTSGLKSGEKVITEGGQKVSEGMKVATK